MADAKAKVAREEAERKAYSAAPHPFILSAWLAFSLMFAVFAWKKFPKVRASAWKAENGLRGMPGPTPIGNSIADGTASAVHNVATSMTPGAALALMGLVLGAVDFFVGGGLPGLVLGVGYSDPLSRALSLGAAVSWAIIGMRSLRLATELMVVGIVLAVAGAVIAAVIWLLHGAGVFVMSGHF